MWQGLEGAQPGLHHHDRYADRTAQPQPALLLDTAGLRRVRFHDLRHSCATLLYERGVPIEKIQDCWGAAPRPSRG
ncbi:tyrosine-type recombinase/integrase [Micromonospora sp. URMC 106]|uniref:tyrosine-type recombinase/integrase n=1 Tax=Micromonospora sp. URMC 106 TaxID=3423408 RepID=UPI003F1BD0B0